MSSGVYMPVQACVHERMSVCVCERERERELNRSLKLLLNASTARAGTCYQYLFLQNADFLFSSREAKGLCNEAVVAAS